MQLDAAIRPRQPCLDQLRMMVPGIIQKDVDRPHVRILGLDRHQNHNGVTTRSVQNCTLSRLAASDRPFANEGMRKELSQTGNQGDSPFKTLLQNWVQR